MCWTTPFAYDDDHHVPTLPDVSVPPREEAGRIGPGASADHFGVGENLGELVSVCRQEIRMRFFDVAFPFLGQLDLAAKPRT